MAHQSHLADLFLQLDGLMSFESFMREALYHPRHGYYASHIATVGRRGDFSTSATISDTLAKAIARWAVLERRETLQTRLGQRWHVIEVGAGDGSLARGFLSHLSLFHRLLLTYHIVETSAPLRLKQREKLPRLQVRWHEDMKEALAACRGCALIFSNELVDAFPAMVVGWNESRRAWEEMVLRDRGIGGVSEEFRRLEEERREFESTVFSAWDPEIVPLRDGQRCEIHRSYHHWQAGWLPRFKQGSMLTIDCGGSFPHLYDKRLQGTVRGYFQGVRLEGMEVYDRYGYQDLTADVNFTDLEKWGKGMGLTTVNRSDQRSFLMEMLPGLEDSKAHRQDSALEFLMSPYGAGKAFQVLRQRKV